MRFLRKIAGLLGIAREDDSHGEGSAAAAAAAGAADAGAGAGDDEHGEAGAPRGGPAVKGFGVQIPVVVERPVQGPVVVPCDLGDQGGVQGFKWYTRSLRIDDDGDVADEFLDEVVTTEVELPAADQAAFPKFQVKYKTRPTAMTMKKQIFAANGNILHNLEHQGRMMLV